MSRRPPLPAMLLLILVCLYALVFGLLAARAYAAHETSAFDLGDYDQALWNAGQGRGLSLTLLPQLGPTRFALHVEPILFLFVPVYRFLTDDPRFLLWLQAFVVALGGLPLYGLARRRLASDWAALAMVAAYFLLPALEAVTLFEFHAVGLAPTFLLAALYFLDRALITEHDPRGLWTGRGKYQISNVKYQTPAPPSRIPSRSLPDPVPGLSRIPSRSPGSGRGGAGSGQVRVSRSANRQVNESGNQGIRESGSWHAIQSSPARTAQPGWANLPTFQLSKLPVLSAFFFLLALSTKEDISLHVFMIGLYLLVLRRRWRPGLALAVVGLLWFYVAFYIIIPASRPTSAGSAYTGFFDSLGDTPIEIALSPVRSPAKVAALLLTADNLSALMMLTLPLALTPLVGLPLLVLSAPTLAITLLSSNPLMHQLETFHYAAPLVPFVILAAVDGVARLANLKSLISNLLTPSSLVLLVLLASLVYHYYRGYSPLARPFHWPQVSAHQRLGEQLAASIPPDVPLVAQAELVPLVDHRPWIQVWQGPFDERAEYFLLDISHPAFLNRDGAQESLLSDVAQDASVGLLAAQDGYLLLHRGAARRPITPEFFTFAYADPSASAVPVAATFGDELQLVAYQVRRNYVDRAAEPLVTLYWRALAPPAEDYFIAVFLLDGEGKPVGVTPYQQPLTVWWPTSRWEPGRTVRLLANTFPWWTGDRRDFGYGVAVLRRRENVPIDSGEAAPPDLHRPRPMESTQLWDVTSRLSVVRQDGGPPPLDGGTLLPLTGFRRVAGIPYAAPFNSGDFP